MELTTLIERKGKLSALFACNAMPIKIGERFEVDGQMWWSNEELIRLTTPDGEIKTSSFSPSSLEGGKLVPWSAKKQHIVSRSNCEIEYRDMSHTIAEIMWIAHLLQELHAMPETHPTILCDNSRALFLTQNPISHKCVKHLELDYHFIREPVSRRKFHTRFVPSKLQVADIFTKSLPRPLFESFRKLLRLGPPLFRLRGVVTSGCVEFPMRIERSVYETGSYGDNSSSILVEKRTRRKPPLNDFRYYNDGWNCLFE
ncbi:hypothetical protein E3N88_38448 [Mikania micrantha]|uniref:Reverse transcriptase Ty1/copia-type domain-containing protein n=1 Tax=Mikania micrantha TaxID=192012 RepID=A0A5N6LU19_9ASTR|nr:hypothetical protein E3N88_38448 [Mikania micrantha]